MNRYFILGFALLMTSACSAKFQHYQGEQRHLNEVAVIDSGQLFQAESVKTNLRVTHVNNGPLIDTYLPVEVLPGRYDIKFGLSRNMPGNRTLFNTKTISFSALPGHYYTAYGFVRPQLKYSDARTGLVSADTWIWVVDFDTGEVVWGERPVKILEQYKLHEKVTLLAPDWRERLQPAAKKRKCLAKSERSFICPIN